MIKECAWCLDLKEIIRDYPPQCQDCITEIEAKWLPKAGKYWAPTIGFLCKNKEVRQLRGLDTPHKCPDCKCGAKLWTIETNYER